jgi:hypothetical protein
VGSAFIGQTALYHSVAVRRFDAWVRGKVTGRSRAAGFSHLVRYGRIFALGSGSRWCPRVWTLRRGPPRPSSVAAAAEDHQWPPRLRTYHCQWPPRLSGSSSGVRPGGARLVWRPFRGNSKGPAAPCSIAPEAASRWLAVLQAGGGLALALPAVTSYGPQASQRRPTGRKPNVARCNAGGPGSPLVVKRVLLEYSESGT